MSADSLASHARRRRRQRAVETIRRRVLPLVLAALVGALTAALALGGVV